jgi:hypothetical protein
MAPLLMLQHQTTAKRQAVPATLRDSIFSCFMIEQQLSCRNVGLTKDIMLGNDIAAV